MIYDILQFSVKQFIEKLSKGDFEQSEIALYVANYPDKQGLLNDLSVEYMAESMSIHGFFDEEANIGVPDIIGKENFHLKSAIDFIESTYRIVALPPQYHCGDALCVLFRENHGVINIFCKEILSIKGKNIAKPIANELIALRELGLIDFEKFTHAQLLQEINKIRPNACQQSAFDNAFADYSGNNKKFKSVSGNDKRSGDIEARKKKYAAFIS